MRKLLIFALLAGSWGASGFAQNPTNLGSHVASLREDVRILVQRVGELGLRVEQLERENSALMRATEDLDSTYATVAQLNGTVAELNQSIRNGDASTRQQTTQAIQELAKQTNSALDSLAKGMATRATIKTPTFDDNFPKEGFSYTIQKGDTLSSIASRFKTTVKFIQNANKITDPTKIQVGQTIFIPGGE
jgi:LysM repeat protein